MEDNYMKCCMFILLLLASTANSAIISYEFKSAWVGSDRSVSTFVIDTESRRLESVSFQSDTANGYSTGPAAMSFELLEEDWHVIDGTSLWGVTFQIGLEFTKWGGDDGTFSGRLHSNYYGIYAPKNADPAFYLNQDDGYIMELVVSGQLFDFVPLGGTYTVIDTGEQPAEVPEPTTLALLSLGLAGLVSRRS